MVIIYFLEIGKIQLWNYLSVFIYSITHTWYQVVILTFIRRVEIDSDNVEGPYGNRGPKKTPGEPITPMLVDAEVYKRFLIYATQELKLEPIA